MLTVRVNVGKTKLGLKHAVLKHLEKVISVQELTKQQRVFVEILLVLHVYLEAKCEDALIMTCRLCLK